RLRAPSRTGLDLCRVRQAPRNSRRKDYRGYRFRPFGCATGGRILAWCREGARGQEVFPQGYTRCAQESAEENNEEPIALRAAPQEVQNRQNLQKKAPRWKKMSQLRHGRPVKGTASLAFPRRSNGTSPRFMRV